MDLMQPLGTVRLTPEAPFADNGRRSELLSVTTGLHSPGDSARTSRYCRESRSEEMQSLNPGRHGPGTTSRSCTSAL